MGGVWGELEQVELQEKLLEEKQERENRGRVSLHCFPGSREQEQVMFMDDSL